MPSKSSIFIPYMLNLLAHECTKNSDISCMYYNYIPNVTCKVPGCLYAAYGQSLRLDNGIGTMGTITLLTIQVFLMNN